MQDRVKGVWYPDLVGRVPRYPKTYEDFVAMQEAGRAQFARLRAEGKLTQQGVPNGWANRKPEIKEIREKAAKRAEYIVSELIKDGIVDADAASNSALASAVEVFERKSDAGEHLHTTRDRLNAIKIVLDFTKSKPVTKQEVTLTPAEAWLAELHNEVK